MRYILNPYIALRSWMLVPYAYYIKGERNARGLTAEEFAFLSACDGKPTCRQKTKALSHTNSLKKALYIKQRAAKSSPIGANPAFLKTAISRR